MAQGDKSGELQLVKVDSLGRVRTTPEEREAILAAYDAGGLSGPKFAEVHGINYQTFAGWRKMRDGKRRRGRGRGRKQKVRRTTVTLVEADTSSSHQADVEPDLRIELPGGATALVGDRRTVVLAADLLRELATPGSGSVPC